MCIRDRYLALEDDYARIQKRLYKMFGSEDTPNLHFATQSMTLGSGLLDPVSYTHLDVYKRQEVIFSKRCCTKPVGYSASRPILTVGLRFIATSSIISTS